jgi:acyl carrier protein
MNVHVEVLRVLDETLGLGGRGAAFGRDTQLLGSLPELDSMAVLAILTALEDQLGLSFDDGDISGEVFESVGSLVDFVSARVGG